MRASRWLVPLLPLALLAACGGENADGDGSDEPNAAEVQGAGAPGGAEMQTTPPLPPDSTQPGAPGGTNTGGAGT